MTLFLQAALLLATGLLMVRVVKEDIRHLDIDAIEVGALGILGIISGALFPLGTLWASLAGCGAAVVLGFSTRVYTAWRTGVPAFGGADIVILAGGGAMLGIEALGAWALTSVVLALVLAFALPLIFGRREAEIDSTEIRALPFCPALILSWAAIYLLSLADLLPIGRITP